MSIWTRFFHAEHLRETQTFIRVIPAPPLASPDPALKADILQLKFLLSQAPMLDVGLKPDWFSTARAPYALVNPKTIAPFTRYSLQKKTIAPYVMFPGSNTQWVVTSLMPEGRVIFTPNPLPGYEKRMA